MARAAQALIGEHDFSAFRAAACQSSTAVRVMREISIEREGDSIAIVVRANAFLHHMVRNIVGSLVRVGRHLEATGWMAETLELGDRKCAGMTAPACGLYFAGIAYPDRYELPSPCYSLNQ
jgi:tRNA pseudouridine38-40 synthase